MTSIEHDAGLADLTAECGRSITGEQVTVGLTVIGLTNFGERPVLSTRLVGSASMAGLGAVRRVPFRLGSRVSAVFAGRSCLGAGA
jgi:hypothetical protein